MSSFVKQLKKVDDRTKYGVYGWVRKAEQELKLQHVPMMISSIIILYFRDDEIFHVIGDDLQLSGNKKIITKKQNDFDWNNNAFGITIIPSTNKIKCEWELNINHCGDRYQGIIAGISSHHESPNKDFEKTKDGIEYAVNCHSRGHKFSYFDRDHDWIDGGFVDETINKLSIELDLINKQVAFSMNNNNESIAKMSVKIKENLSYRLMVSIQGINDSAEIVDFNRQ